MIKKIYIILFLIYATLLSSGVFAQENSLKNKIEKCEIALQEKYIDVLSDCVNELPEDLVLEKSKFNGFIAHKKGNYSKAEGFYIQFLKLNKNIYEEITYSIEIANLYVHQANFYQAVHYYSNAFKLNKEIEEKNISDLNIAKIKIGLSDIFYYLNVKSEVVLEYKEIIKLLEPIKTKESMHLLNKVYFLLSILYTDSKQEKLAEEYALKSYKVADESDYLLGIGYAKKAISYVYTFSQNEEKKQKSIDLVREAEEIFDLLDIQDKIVFNLEVIKINMMIKDGEYNKARNKIRVLEQKYARLANSYNNLSTIYNLYYNLYIKTNNLTAALSYKWKEIEINKEIRNDQNTHIVLKFKNEFNLAENEKENEKLILDKVKQENEILKVKQENYKYNNWLYISLTLIIVLLLLITIVIIKRKYLLVNKIKQEKEIMNTGKEVWGEGYYLRKKKDQYQKEENYALIGYKVKDIEKELSGFSVSEMNSFNLFVENTIKNKLRKGDVLFKKEERLFILAKANLDEAYFIAERLKKALKLNKYIKDNIYIGVVNGENDNGIENSIEMIDQKIERGIQKGEKIRI